MSLANRLNSIESDIGKGLKFKAADRLRNLINQYPNELHLWDRLAELYYESGFLDAAGRYWILIEPKDEHVKKCVEIYEASVNYSGYQILQEITFRGDKDKLPDFGQKKLLELERDSKMKSNYVPKFSLKLNKSQITIKKKETFTFKVLRYVLLLIIITVPILAIIGLGQVLKWVL